MRPTLPSSESCSTFFTFLPALGLAYARFLISDGASWCLAVVKSKLGPISSSSTRGMRVPDFLYLIAHCRNITLSASAVHTITRSTPLRLMRVAGRPRNTSLRMFFASRSAGSVSKRSPRNTMHGLLPSTACDPALPKPRMGLKLVTHSSTMSNRW